MSDADPITVGQEGVAAQILFVRGHRVMLDHDLAALYQVATKNLNTAVKRNAERFPPDFMFRITNQEVVNLRLQIAASSSGHGSRRHLPYAFTEQGVAMLSSVLKSRRAVLVNVEIMRTFARLRALLSTHAELEGRYDRQFKVVFDAIRKLMAQPEPERRPIGFTADR